jgi:hypothetical protein
MMNLQSIKGPKYHSTYKCTLKRWYHGNSPNDFSPNNIFWPNLRVLGLFGERLFRGHSGKSRSGNRHCTKNTYLGNIRNYCLLLLFLCTWIWGVRHSVEWMQPYICRHMCMGNTILAPKFCLRHVQCSWGNIRIL